MITAGILTFVFGVLYLVLSPLLLLNDVSSTSAIATSVSTANGYISAVPFHLFLVSLFATLLFLGIFESAYWAYKGIMWVAKKLPFISG